MEIILAIVVTAAVVFFGALISAGNERQRKAIDGLREQAVLWALQDLRIKRERLARDVKVDDPIGWLNKIAAKVSGLDMVLQVVEVFEESRTLICISSGGTTKLLFTAFSPKQINERKRLQRTRLNQFANRDPLMFLPRNVTPHEFSVLNSGILFDLELPMVWKGITGQDIKYLDRLWVYMIS